MKQNISKNRQFLIDRLGVLRTRQKFSARELSLRLGFSVNYINRFESGNFSIPAEVLLEAIEICNSTRFESGNFSIPAEVLLEAIEICNSTPEEFFSPNIDKFKEHQELLAKYDKLSPQSKQNLLNIIDSLK